MKKYRTFIVEDQDAPLERLLSLLKAYPKVIDLDSIMVARTFDEAQNIILNGEHFDLSILDKKLGEKTCFDLITRENIGAFGIIAFNTIDRSAQKHLQEASIFGNFLVLHKPYNKDDVAELINKLIAFNKPPYEDLLDDRPIWLKEKGKGFPVKQKDVVYIEVDDNYCYIYYLENSMCKKHVATKQLSHYEAMLNKEMFFRISDKHLINLEHILNEENNVITMRSKCDPYAKTLNLSKNKALAFHNRFKK